MRAAKKKNTKKSSPKKSSPKKVKKASAKSTKPKTHLSVVPSPSEKRGGFVPLERSEAMRAYDERHKLNDYAESAARPVARDRTVPYDANAKCDSCGATGAFDFMGDNLCDACASKAMSEENKDQAEPKMSLIDAHDLAEEQEALLLDAQVKHGGGRAHPFLHDMERAEALRAGSELLRTLRDSVGNEWIASVVTKLVGALTDAHERLARQEDIIAKTSEVLNTRVDADGDMTIVSEIKDEDIPDAVESLRETRDAQTDVAARGAQAIVDLQGQLDEMKEVEPCALAFALLASRNFEYNALTSEEVATVQGAAQSLL